MERVEENEGGDYRKARRTVMKRNSSSSSSPVRVMIAIGVGDTRAIVAGAVMVALSLMRVLFGPSDNIREQVYREDIPGYSCRS